MDEAEEAKEFDATFYKNDSKKSRMLKLELTDGKKTVIALEYSPIACLNTKLVPGSKILLTGPIRCINQVLFLEPKNLKVLGGEVDTMVIVNAYENILLKQLGKPMNQTPNIQYKELPVVEVRKQPHQIPISEQTPFQASGNIKTTTSTLSVQSSFQSTAIPLDVAMDDDDFLLGVNLDAIENQVTSKPIPSTRPPPLNSIPAPVSNIPPALKYDDFDDFELLHSLENEIRNESWLVRQVVPPIAQPSPPQIPKPTIPVPIRPEKRVSPRIPLPVFAPSTSILQKNLGLLNDFIDESNFFDSTLDFDISNLVEKEAAAVEQMKQLPTILDADYPYKVDGCSLVTIEQMYMYTAQEKAGMEFVMFCEIDSVAEKLHIKNNEFCLGVFLKDTTDSDRLLQVCVNFIHQVF